MVGFLDGNGLLKALKLMLIFWIFEAQKSVVLCDHVNLEKINADATLPCIGAREWYNPLGVRIVHDGTKYLIGNGNLTITRVGANDLGRYFCHGNTNQTVELHARPFVKPLDKSYNVIQGNVIDVTCVTTAFPVADVIWLKEVDGNLVNISKGNNLIIENADKDDYGMYTCEATNMHGNDSSETKIRVKDKLAPLWPFIGILIEVVILIVIIVIYEKKKSKRENDENLKDNTPKSGENNASNVRQRK